MTGTMKDHEAWIHITASSTRRDDRKYEAQLSAIAAFEPARRIKIYPADELIVESIETSDTGAGPALAGEIRTPSQLGRPSNTQSAVRSSDPAASSAQYLTSSERQHGPSQISDEMRSSSPSVRQSLRLPEQWPPLLPHEIKAINPPYKNPIVGHLDRNTVIQAFQTPDQPRPQTAPASSTSQTHPPVQSRKRSRSESSSFDTLASVVPDSQSGQDEGFPLGLHGPKRRQLERFDDGHRLGQLHSSVSDGTPRSHRVTSGDVAAYHSDGMQVLNSESTSELDPTRTSSSPPSAIIPATARQDPPCFFLANRDYDYDTSVGLSQSMDSSTPDDSTESPSQSMRHQVQPQSPFFRQPPDQVDSAITAYTISSTSDASSVQRQRTSHSILDANTACGGQEQDQPPPIRHETSPDISLTTTTTTTSLTPNPFPRITSLPRTIFPSPPATGTANHEPTSHLTPHLSMLASKLSFPKRFRPIHVTREISPSERGHWHIPILIANDAAVQTLRQQIQAIRTARLKLSATPDLGLDLSLAHHPEPPSPWLVSEFLTFHASLRQHFHASIVGWATRVFFDFSPLSNLSALPIPTTSSSMTIDMKVTTWGDVVPHLYLALWVLSDRRIGMANAEWRDAQGTGVVFMRGRSIG